MRRTQKAAMQVVTIILVLAALAFEAGCGKQVAVERETTGKPAVLDFWQPGCPPCDAMEPLLEQLEEEYGGRVDFFSYNVYEAWEEAESYGIRATPTFIFLDTGGKEVSRLLGKQSMDTMRSHIEKALKE